MTGRVVVALACALLACGGPPPVIIERPPLPSTHRDPVAEVPAPRADPHTGELIGMIASGGEEQARELLFALVLAVRDQDPPAIVAVLAPSVLHVGTLRRGRARGAVPAGTVAQQLVLQARLAQLRSDARFESVVDPASIQVEPIAVSFPEGLPPELEPGDLLVRFTLSPTGRRAMGVLTQDGQAAIIVRPGEGARIIAR